MIVMIRLKPNIVLSQTLISLTNPQRMRTARLKEGAPQHLESLQTL